MYARIGKLLVLVGIGAITGCSTLGYGHQDTHCEESPDAPNCQGPIENYEDTETTDHIPSTQEEEAELEEEEKRVRELAALENRAAPVEPPMMDRTRPIRRPAKVLRIWVAPWVGESDQLNMPGYIYAEVEQRRWMIGEERPESAAGGNIHPLQVEPGASEKYGNEDGDSESQNQSMPGFPYGSEGAPDNPAEARQRIREQARELSSRP